MAQSVAAIHGTTCILDHEIKSIRRVTKDAPELSSASSSPPPIPYYSIDLQRFLHPVTADVVVASPSYTGLLGSPISSALQPSNLYLARCIAILDKRIRFPSTSLSPFKWGLPWLQAKQPIDPEINPDNYMIVFPPGKEAALNTGPKDIKLTGPVSVLVMGASSLSCPEGKCKADSQSKHAHGILTRSFSLSRGGLLHRSSSGTRFDFGPRGPRRSIEALCQSSHDLHRV